MRLAFVFLLMISSVLISCGKDDDSSSSGSFDQKMLFGMWGWQATNTVVVDKNGARANSDRMPYSENDHVIFGSSEMHMFCDGGFALTKDAEDGRRFEISGQKIILRESKRFERQTLAMEKLEKNSLEFSFIDGGVKYVSSFTRID